MKVFISWSGPKSREVAEKLRDWLPRVIQVLDPWLASRDINKGARWHTELGRQLSATRVAIICLTKENAAAPWIAFEAGALSRELDRAFVCPYLIDIAPDDLPEPLSQFQVTVAEKEDTRKLVHTLNRALHPKSIPEGIVNDAFDSKWPDLWKRIQAIQSSQKSEAVELANIMNFGTNNEEPVELTLAKVKKEFRVSGNDCKKIIEAKSADIETLLRRGANAKVICVDPSSPACSMLAKVDPRFRSAGDFRKSMVSVLGILRDLRKRYPSLLEYRLLPVLPAFGLFITDPELPTRIVRVELYASKPWTPIAMRPRLLLPSTLSDWQQYFLSQWDNYWALAQSDV
jgi:TIR domain-containing protein